MSNKVETIYGLPGFSLPGKTGINGDTGLSMQYSDKSGWTLNNESNNLQLNNEFKRNEKAPFLSSIDLNVYYKDDDYNSKYYQFNYNIDFDNLDDLKVEAYLIFRKSSGDDKSIDEFYPWRNITSTVTIKDKCIILKEYDSTETNKFLSNIKYDDKMILRKVILFGYVREHEYQAQKFYIGEKEFTK